MWKTSVFAYLSVAEAFPHPHLPGAGNHTPICRPGEAHGQSSSKCKINGDGCDSKEVTFPSLDLTVLKWDKTTKNYTDAGFLEAHALAGSADDWQMYLHGPMIRPAREKSLSDALPPFYVQATFTNQVYRFDHTRKLAGRGQPMRAHQKVVAHAIAPSTSYPIEKDGNLQGMLVAEGQPFLLSSPLDREHTQLYFGGVDYINDDAEDCHKVYPSEVDAESHMKLGDVVNSVSCNEATGICFFSVWKFYDDQAPIWEPAKKFMHNDCLHYCVMEAMDGSSTKCTKAGIVRYENGDQICSKEGVGGVHGMVVDNQQRYDDPSEFDIFLVMTGGATFDAGESSLEKVKCKKNEDGDLVVLSSNKNFSPDLYQASVGRDSPFGMAEHDAGGDHAWPDESGKYLWVSTFRLGNAGVHMLDYQTGDLIYSVHGMDRWYEQTTGKQNYAYSAGIHGIGQLGSRGSTLVVGTSACTNTDVCMPIPYLPITPEKLEAVGVMFAIDLSEIHKHAWPHHATPVVV